MMPAIAIEKHLETEIARALEIMGHVRDRPESLNEADIRAAGSPQGKRGAVDHG